MQRKLYVVGDGYSFVSEYAKTFERTACVGCATIFKNYRDAYNMLRRFKNRSKSDWMSVITLKEDTYLYWYWENMNKHAI